MSLSRTLLSLSAVAVTLCSSAAFAIKNGTPADNQQFPTAVEFRVDNVRMDNGLGILVGSGVIIRPDIILTAAHVVNNWRPDSTQYVVWNGQHYKIAGRVVHPAFKTADKIDLAVVKLAQALPVQGSALASKAPNPGETLTIVGFGRDGNTSERLQGMGNMHRGTVVVDAIASTPQYANDKIKVSPGAGGTIACEGDSGGPAFAGAEVSGIFYHYVTRGNVQNKSMCSLTYKSVYSTVATFASWINQTADQLEGHPDAAPAAQNPTASGGRIAQAAPMTEDIILTLTGDRLQLAVIDGDIARHQSAQPRIATALRQLTNAHEALAHAAHDYDGHRERALRVIDTAIMELHEDIASADARRNS